jgi:hypothetical protein
MEPILTPEMEAFIAKKIMENKPYLIEIEDRINELGGFGTLDIRLEIRGNKVEKASFLSTKTWLRLKTQPNSIDINKKES